MTTEAMIQGRTPAAAGTSVRAYTVLATTVSEHDQPRGHGVPAAPRRGAPEAAQRGQGGNQRGEVVRS